ncbi:hypothetical protein HDV00_006138 [Rhizophlyctis rosea]|nr:hypothetical protein HDV00_006138 [Rhizophlyctis rosea]
MKIRYTKLSQQAGEVGEKYKASVQMMDDVVTKMRDRARQAEIATQERERRMAEVEIWRRQQAVKDEEEEEQEEDAKEEEDDEGNEEEDDENEGYGSEVENWVQNWANSFTDRWGGEDRGYHSVDSLDEGHPPYGTDSGSESEEDPDGSENQEQRIRQLEEDLKYTLETAARYKVMYESAKRRADQVEDQQQFWMMMALIRS